MDEKKKQDMPNKAIHPAENKRVRIRFRPNRAATGVEQDEQRYATVDEATADRLVRIGFADRV